MKMWYTMSIDTVIFAGFLAVLPPSMLGKKEEAIATYDKAIETLPFAELKIFMHYGCYNN